MNYYNILQEVKAWNNVIIFGCGKNGKIIYEYLKKIGAERKILCFADNKQKNGDTKGKKIVRPEIAKEMSEEAVWIISSPQYSAEMSRQLLQMGIDRKAILRPSEHDMRIIYICTQKHWYNEDGHFMYEYGFPLNLKFIADYMKSVFRERYYAFILKKDSLFCHVEKRYKFNVSICAIFLNEAFYMREWVEFHRMVGVDHFYLYNNMSDDGYMEILKPYIEAGIVTLIDWTIPHGQIAAYWDCIRRFSEETRWIGFIDLDEFVVPRENTIYDFLRQYNSMWGSVLIYWKTFGSSGKKERNLYSLVTEDFKACWPKLHNQGKCFYNTAYGVSDEKKNGLGFHHVFWTRRRGKDVPPVNMFGVISFPGNVQRAKERPVPIQINHYLIKSYKEYQKKMNQPDSTFEKNLRTDSIFRYFDERATGTDNMIERYLPELKKRLGKEEDMYK